MDSNELDQILVRCTLPVRDVALSPDGCWAAVASEYVLALQVCDCLCILTHMQFVLVRQQSN